MSATTLSKGPRHRLDFGRLALVIDAADGGRIVEYSLDGDNVLATRSDSPAAYGSSFWPSPQSDWDWPPPAELDREPWIPFDGGAPVALRSGTNVALGLCATARYRADERSGAVRIDYTLENRSPAPRRVAPWQNTRVRPRGLTFYPSPSTHPRSTLRPVVVDGIAWLRHDPETMNANAKSFADGSEGFLAHVERDLLFVKVWADVTSSAQAPGEGEVELYVDRSGRFVEIEQQGAYVEIAPGASSEWRVDWILSRLETGVAARIGSGELVERARALARVARSESAVP